MPHPCKSHYWGESVPPLLQWLDYLDANLPPQSVSHLTLPTWQAMCVLQFELETATEMPHTPPAPWLGDVPIDPGDEILIRQVVLVMLAGLVADQYDTTHPDPHDPQAPGWLKTPRGANNPELGAMDTLVGPAAPAVDSSSLLGKVRNALGS